MINPLNIQPIPRASYRGCPSFRIFEKIESLNPFTEGEAIIVRYRDYFILPDGSEETIQSCTYKQDISALDVWFNTVLPEGVTVGQGILGAINSKLSLID